MNQQAEQKYLQQPSIAIDTSLRTRCEVWTRVMGYHRPVSSFNTGKQGEFNEKTFFTEAASSQGGACSFK